MLIVITGRAGTGKTAVAKEVCKMLSLPLIETSSFLKKIANQEDSHKQRQELHDVKYKYQDEDPDWLWNYVEEDLDKIQGQCIMSGIREPYLLYKVLNRYEDVFVIGLESSSFNRYARLCQRDGHISTEKFFDIDKGDTDLGIGITLTGCDILIDANSDLKQVVTAVGQIISRRMMGK